MNLEVRTAVALIFIVFNIILRTLYSVLQFCSVSYQLIY